MAWAACWTLLRSRRPLQQLGEQGDVGRGPSPLSLFLPFIYRLSSVLPHSVPSLICPWHWWPPSTSLSLSGLALLSEVEGSQYSYSLHPFWCRQWDWVPTRLRSRNPTSQDPLEALLQVRNSLLWFLAQDASAIGVFSCALELPFLLSSFWPCVYCPLCLLSPGSILFLFLIVWLLRMTGVTSPRAAFCLASFSLGTRYKFLMFCPRNICLVAP